MIDVSSLQALPTDSLKKDTMIDVRLIPPILGISHQLLKVNWAGFVKIDHSSWIIMVYSFMMVDHGTGILLCPVCHGTYNHNPIIAIIHGETTSFRGTTPFLDKPI